MDASVIHPSIREYIKDAGDLANRYAFIFTSQRYLDRYVRSRQFLTFDVQSATQDFRTSLENLLTRAVRDRIADAYYEVDEASGGRLQNDTNIDDYLDEFIPSFYSSPFEKHTTHGRLTLAGGIFRKALRSLLIGSIAVAAVGELQEVARSRIPSQFRTGKDGAGYSPTTWAQMLLAGESERAYLNSFFDLAERAGGKRIRYVVLEGACPVCVGLEGIYLVGNVPAFPHPYCRCILEVVLWNEGTI